MIPWFISEMEDSSRLSTACPYTTATITLQNPKDIILIPYSDSESSEIKKLTKRITYQIKIALNIYIKINPDADYNPIDNLSNIEEHEAKSGSNVVLTQNSRSSTSSNSNFNDVRLMKNNNVGKQIICDNRDICLFIL